MVQRQDECESHRGDLGDVIELSGRFFFSSFFLMIVLAGFLLHEAAAAAATDAPVGGAPAVFVVRRFPPVETSGVGVVAVTHRLLF